VGELLLLEATIFQPRAKLIFNIFFNNDILTDGAAKPGFLLLTL